MEGENRIRNGFIVTGTDFKKAIKLLKIAWPRKKKEQQYVSAVFKVQANTVTLAMPGATVELSAFGYGQFSCEVPFVLFKDICRDVNSANQSYTFVFDHGLVSVNGLSSRFPTIIFHEDCTGHAIANPALATDKKTHTAAKTANSAALMPDNQMVGLGLPLLGIYYQLKQYPPGTLTNPRFLKGYQDVEDILNKVDSLLRPLGLGRHTIEKILDDRNPYRPK